MYGLRGLDAIIKRVADIKRHLVFEVDSICNRIQGVKPHVEPNGRIFPYKVYRSPQH
jgi:hypothetical protein